MRGFGAVVLSCLAPLLLAGCASTSQLIARDDNYCKSIGAKPGTKIYAECRLTRDKLRSDNQSQALDEIALGARLMQGSKPSTVIVTKAPTHTSCVTYSHGADCTTY